MQVIDLQDNRLGTATYRPLSDGTTVNVAYLGGVVQGDKLDLELGCSGMENEVPCRVHCCCNLNWDGK